MTTIPKGATVPADHKKSAAQIEAEGVATIDVEWRGQTFTIAADPGDWKVTTSLAFEDGKAVTGVKGVLGDAQWASLLKAQDPSNKELGELFEVIGERMGLGPAGN